MAQDTDALVLDAVVLIGFETAGWFESIAFWRPEYDLLVPRSIWEDEFDHGRSDPPSWLDVCSVETTVRAERPGALSRYDWHCLQLATTHDATLITADHELKQMASDRGLDTLWAGRFALDTFEECGISRTAYDGGIEAFLEDLRMPQSSADVLRNAEK